MSDRRSHLVTFVRFGFVGALNSLIHAAVVLALAAALPAWHGFVLVLIGWVVCVPIGYVTQAKLVWHARLSVSGLTKISLSQIPSATVSTLLAALGGALGFPIIVQEGMALVAGAVISYVLQRFWVFRVRPSEPATSDSKVEL